MSYEIEEAWYDRLREDERGLIKASLDRLEKHQDWVWGLKKNTPPKQSFQMIEAYALGRTQKQIIEEFRSKESVVRAVIFCACRALSHWHFHGYEEAPELSSSIDRLTLSVAARNLLKNERIDTIDRLLSYSWDKLRKLEGFGPRRLDEIERALNEHGFRIAGPPRGDDDLAALLARRRRIVHQLDMIDAEIRAKSLTVT
jgi:hypothetical protein